MLDVAEKTLADLEWARLMRAIADRCASEPAAQGAMGLPLLEDLAAISSRLALVDEAIRLRAEGQPLGLEQVRQVEPLVGRTELSGTLEPQELCAIAATLKAACDAGRRILARRALYPALSQAMTPVRAVEGLAARLADKFELDGTVSDRASPELRRARAAAAAERARVIHRIEELIERYHDVLQDAYYTVREERYVLPVRTDAHERVPGIVHGTSSSGATVFVEPRHIIEIGNRLKMAVGEVEREEARILAELSAEVGRAAGTIRAAAAAVVGLDLLLAIAHLSSDLQACIPMLSVTPRIEVFAGRHPLLLLDGVAVVDNDLTLEPGRALVVSGPNAGGKTVALKMVALFALMVRAGLPIPAGERSEIGIFGRVLTDIGDSQSLSLSLSTFSAHLTNLSRILGGAGYGDMVVLDELAAGTDPDEGAALARAVTEALCARGVTVAVTTHYPALKEAATVDPQFVNASVGFNVNEMRPSFRVTVGVPGSSVALAIASRFGIPADVVQRARTLLAGGAIDFSDAVMRLERERARAEQETCRATEERARAEEARREAELERERARSREDKHVRREVAEVLDAVQRTRAEVARAAERVRRRRVGPEDVQQARDELARAAPAVAPGGPLSRAVAPPPEGRYPAAHEIAPGLEVWVSRLGSKGRVVEHPRKGKVRIALGALTTTVELTEVRLLSSRKPAAPQTRTPPATYDAAADATAPAQTSENTRDLRGLRAEEAVEASESFLDRMMREGKQCAFLIHGHGTGALRAKVRESLGASRYVSRFRPGEQSEGGDGVTVVWLR